ncbi:MAG: enoyl-CoA hydratase/isomerase family protein [Betaproteobacteria bacterium]|nr:enoyl-CoA hydratase/isomerase family protein [Betaproteobacteria bacterium]
MISLAIEGAIAVATLCRPPVNAINDEWIDRLNRVLDEVEAAQGVSVLWIRSAERLFSAGADLALMRSRFDTEEGRSKMTAFARELQTVYARLEAMQQVSVAEIGGPAMGGGLELALACDLRVIGESARVGLPEARLGLLPGAGGTQRLTRICGDAISRRLILGAEIVGGTEALALGLAHWAAPAEGVQAAARAVVERIAELPQAALAACKRCIAAALDAAQNGFEKEIEATAMLLASAETRQRVHRFLNKG